MAGRNKKLPRLTEVASHNAKREGYFGTFAPVPDDEPRTYGGFYTQNDIRAMVKYAKDRFVDILPEVDVPGHSMSAIVAYPDLSCTAGADKYQVISGEKFMDWPGPRGKNGQYALPGQRKSLCFPGYGFH